MKRREVEQKKKNCKINETSVVCPVGPSVNLFQNRGNSTYENCFVKFEI